MPLSYRNALDFLAADASAFADVASRLDGAQFAAQVPSCPGWTVRDLVGHLGSVHRWAAEIVRTGEVAEQRPAPTVPAALAPWFAEGVDLLIASMTSAVPGQPCWNFGPPPRVVDFWVRRQALETAVHRWDLLAALGRQTELDGALAEDGVDEVVTMMFPRQVRLGRVEPLTDVVELRVAESAAAWLLSVDGVQPPGPAQATVTASAADLFLLLWRRIAPTDPRVTVTGDPAAAQRVLSTALTP
jgi:uncharacterized protein (TIGR03083 family)